MKGIVLIGMPCSGKTSSCEYLEEEKGLKYYSTGDIVREMCAEEKGEDYDNSELGEFSTKKRQEDVTYATKGALWKARRADEDFEVVVFEGIRCVEEVDYLEEELDELLTIFIEVPFDERARRLIERGREGENSKDVMKERDERELGWGLEEIVTREYYDVEIDGDCSEQELYEKVEDEVESFLD